MPHFTFPRSPEGYVLDVVIGLSTADIAALQAAGQPVPPHFHARALLDTASDMTAVTPRLLQPLGMKTLGRARTHTAGGLVKVGVYEVSLVISDPTGTASVPLVRSPWRVTEFLHAPPQIDVLLGLDLADQCLLFIDGPGRRCTLGY
jgi:hypothetical protein